MSEPDEMGVTEATPLGRRDQVTLVRGTSFVVCAPGGEMGGEANEGYFADDTRVVSRLRVDVAGLGRRDLTDDGASAVAGIGDPTRPRLLLRRALDLDEDRLVLTLRVENLEADPWDGDVTIVVDADFADVFQVKRGDPSPRGSITRSVLADGLLLSYRSDGFERSVRIGADDPLARPAADARVDARPDGLRFAITLGPRAGTTLVARIEPVAPAPPRSPSGAFDRARRRSAELFEQLAAAAPPPGSGQRREVWEHACRDLASLVIADDQSGRAVIAAGSPWFMALFGRDSLISGMATLATGPDLLVEVLHALAARQGTRWDDRSAEQPGRILHEVRRGETTARPDGWGSVYYGTVDATPLFVLAIHRAWRAGAAEADVSALLAPAERAVAWMLGPADVAGLGLVGYVVDVDHDRPSLRNQCWKDSDDGVRHGDGRSADGCILPVEVQGYAEAALRGMAELREAFGTGPAGPLLSAADRIADALDRRFWMPDESCYAVALDGDGEAIRSVTSNPGHLLWSGVVPPHRARALASRLLEDDLFTGAGLRTLSSVNPGYNPLSYHCGSVWPHDSALAAAGMLRSGCVEEGVVLAEAVLALATSFGGRVPELVAGLPATDSRPVPYPSACCPQAWASAAVVLLVSELARAGR